VWIKPAVWGAIFGAVAIMIVGFSWTGWNLGRTTKRLVAEGSESADDRRPHSVLRREFHEAARGDQTPCFEKTPLRTQRDIIEKAGFATMPGNKEPSSGVAAACEIALRAASVAGPQPLAEAKAVTK
jgi:hypothetical protein